MIVNFLRKKLKLDIYDLLFIIILFIGLFFRLNHFVDKYPVGDGDVSRDYLVAHHIVKYGELPSIGPWNSIYGSLRNSPLYFYLLAFFLRIKDDILFLGLTNVFLQSLVIVLIYLLAKTLFSPSTALLASLLFSFSQEIFSQSTFVWQPHIMQPFLFLSYYLFFLSYKKTDFLLTLFGILTYGFSAGLHYSLFTTIPMICLLIFIILKKQKRKIGSYILTFSLLNFSFLVSYLPVINDLIKNQAVSFFVTEKVYVDDPFAFLQNFFKNILTLINIFFLNLDKDIYSVNNILVFILIVCAVLYFSASRTEGNKKKYLALILLFILQPIFFSSFLKTFIYYHYLTPVFGLFFIFMAEIINAVFAGKLMIIKILIIILLVKIFSWDLYIAKWNYSELNRENVYFASQAIKEELDNIQKETGLQNLDTFDGAKLHSLEWSKKAPLSINPEHTPIFKPESRRIDFFRIVLFKKDDGETASDSVFWVQLEQRLNTKFVKLIDGYNNYEPLNNGKYIFLVCQSYIDVNDEREECVKSFISSKSNYLLVKQIDSRQPFSIYLTKRNDE